MIKNREQVATTNRHSDALDAIESGIHAASPRRAVERSVRFDGSVLEIGDARFELDDYERVVVLGGGNAASQLARAVESVLGDALDSGIVVTDDPCEPSVVDVLDGTHPLPSEANVDGTERLLEQAAELTESDLAVVCLTGGGSALLCAPVAGVSLAEYRDVTDQLLRSGAPIGDINAVRKHLSTIKGGQLARALAPAESVGVIVSDVVGNRLDVIASGPTTPDPTTYEDALAVCDRFDIDSPESVDEQLTAGAAGRRPETPDESDPLFDPVTNQIIADGRTALEASAQSLREDGYETAILSAEIEGEAATVGEVHAAIAGECLKQGRPFDPPVALFSGGETTVTVTGDGRGGPNQEFVLGAALACEDDILVVGVDTDGIDGNSDAAGAILDADALGDTASEARTALSAHDVTSYLDSQQALIRTGPTGTNVNDLRIVLVGTPE
ncbi:glycerate kinase type-2 family protein [Halovenus marina]|uniref:glycerate kinase type-2 family protein n=1 Tax=Halovenus marina TaxID=3396621 RepID=UPI003F5767BC